MSLTGSGAAAPSLWELLARSLTKSAARFLKCIAQAADPPPPHQSRLRPETFSWFSAACFPGAPLSGWASLGRPGKGWCPLRPEFVRESAQSQTKMVIGARIAGPSHHSG